jgi:hypothetical protein
VAQGCTLQPHSRAAVQSHGARRQDRRQVSSHADVSQQRYSRACDWPPAAPVAARRYSHAQARFTFGCRSAQHYPKNYVMVLARYPLRYPSAVTSARDRRRRSASTSASKSYPSPTLTSRLNSIYLTRQARDPFPPSGRAAQSYRHVPKLLGLGSIANGGPSAGQSIFRDLVLSYVRRRHAPFAARPAGRHHLCLGMTC